MTISCGIRCFLGALPVAALMCFTLTASAADEEFLALTKRLEAAKPTFAKRQQDMLAERYDIADTVEFFNLVPELKPNEREKKDLMAFMRAP